MDGLNLIKTPGAVQKNSDGHLGPQCNNCGGYGYTNTITGGSIGCQHCESTGVAMPSKVELLQRLAKLESKSEEGV